MTDDEDDKLITDWEKLAELAGIPKGQEALHILDEVIKDTFGDKVSSAKILLNGLTPCLYVSFINPGEAKFGPFLSVEFSDDKLYADDANPDNETFVLAEFDGESWTVLSGDVVYKFVKFHTFAQEEKEKKELASRVK